jgi:uncharacterized membrane protein YgcG
MATRYISPQTEARREATRKAAAGRAERRQKALDKQHKDGYPTNYWKKKAAPITYGREHFSIDAPLIGRRGVGLDDLVGSISWEDAGVILKGSITLYRPVHMKEMVLQEGDLLRCRMRKGPSAPWGDLWRMRIKGPEIDLGGGTYTYTLTSDLARLQASEDDFRYVKDKKHTKGWLASAITRDVCRRYKVKVGKLPATKHRIKKLNEKNASPLDVILKVYERDNKETGKTYVIDYWGARINVTSLRRSKTMLELGPTLIEATMKAAARNPEFATVLTVRATSGGKGKKKKLTAKITSAAGVKRFGLIHKTVTVKGADSEGELRKKGKRMMAENKVGKPARVLSVTHPGIPTLRRGQALRIRVKGHDLSPEEDDLRQICFVKSVTHSVEPGAYNMEITLGFTDAVDDARRKRVTQLKKEVARKRKRAQEAEERDDRRDSTGGGGRGDGGGGGGGSSGRTQARTSPRARQRGDGPERRAPRRSRSSRVPTR